MTPQRPSLPLSVTDLMHYLPHRPPMIWVDRVVELFEQGGITETLLQPMGRYCKADGTIGFATMAELMAQSFGYVESARHMLESGDRSLPERAYLAHIRNYKVDRLPIVGTVLRTRVQCIRTLGPLHLIQGTVTDDQNCTCAQAELKLFGGTPP